MPSNTYLPTVTRTHEGPGMGWACGNLYHCTTLLLTLDCFYMD
jgi:hypothetical protein